MPTDRSYDESKLLPIDASSLVSAEWARTWARFWLRDKPDEDGAWPKDGLSDAELDAALQIDAVGTSTRYYRPHVTAGRLITGDPDRFKQLAMEGFSKTLRDPELLRVAWLEQGRAFDAFLPDGILPTSEVRRQRGSRITRYETSF